MILKARQIKQTVVAGAIVLAFFSIGANKAAAQTDSERIAELRQQIELLEQQAQQYKGNIAEQQAKAQTLQRDIAILKNQISNLEVQIHITNNKIVTTKIEITKLDGQIFDNQQTITRQKNAIGRLVLFLDQYDNESLLATLLKHNTLSDFFDQAHYIDNINAQILDAIDELHKAQTDLESTKFDYQAKQTELNGLVQQQTSQQNALNGAKTQKSQILTQTKGEEARYQQLLTETERKSAEFFTELQVLEKKIVAGGLYIVHVTATSVPPKGSKIFAWPEDSRYITQRYGMTAYARRGAYGGAPHNGIDISGGYGSPIYAIGDGVVIANGTENPGWGTWVAIKHANNMVSVYAHMSATTILSVVGSNVKRGDTIGYEGNTGNVTGSHVHLSLYKDYFTYDKGGELNFNYWDGTVNPLDYL